MKKFTISTLALLLILVHSYAASTGAGSVKYSQKSVIEESDVKAPNDGVVADLNLNKETAIKVAEMVLVYIYGETVLAQRPWKVTENKTEFKIAGTLHYKLGGVAEIVIRKSDGKIISYSHGQ